MIDLMDGIELKGIFPPIITPFDSHGELALDRLRANLTRYNATGLKGYVVVGSTGESVYLTEPEVLAVWDTAREAAAPGKTLIAGTGVESTRETIARTNRAAAAGYRAALVKTPHYFKPQMNPVAMAAHFRAVADGAKIPILVYVVPQFTGIALEAGEVARLSEHPNIIGIKESSGNVQRVAEIVAQSRPGFQVLVGSAPTLYPSLAVGAIGGILAAACCLPELCVDIHEAFFRGETDKARHLQQLLLEPARAVTSACGIAGLKYAMERFGYYGGAVRSPLQPLTTEERKYLDNVFARLETRFEAAR